MPSTGSNRALVVIPISTGGNNVAFSGSGGSVVYNGTAMTQIVSVVGASNNGRIMNYLPNPTTGTHDIVATLETVAGSRDIAVIAFVLQDCVQTSPVDVTSTLSNGTSTSAAPSVTTTTDNDIVIGWVSPRSASSLTSSQTLVAAAFDPAGSGWGQLRSCVYCEGNGWCSAIDFSWIGSTPYDAVCNLTQGYCFHHHLHQNPHRNPHHLRHPPQDYRPLAH